MTCSKKSRSLIDRLVLAALTVSLLSGCGRRAEPEFTADPLTKTLLPEAQKAVSGEMEQNFGTLKNLHVPLEAPLNWGGVNGTLERESATGESGSQWRAALAGGSQLQSGEKLRVVSSGDVSLEFPAVLTVESYTSSQGLVQVKEELPNEATEPVKIVARPTHQLVTGQTLYTRHCAACHGVSGAGDGPQSQILNPKPRDFRYGLLKYTSTSIGHKASTKDLRRTIKEGIAGTGMPAFKALANQEIDQIIDYAKYLAIRGEVERSVATDASIDFSRTAVADRKMSEVSKDLADYVADDLPEIFLDEIARICRQWEQGDAKSNVVKPTLARPDPLEPSQADANVTSLANGRRIYLSKSGQCASCHGETGRGDGSQTQQFHKRRDGSSYDRPGLHDAWGHPVKPRDLTYGVFHGGRDPVDIYRRVYAGVKGTPMPAYGMSGLSEAEIWDLVNYLLYLAGDYPQISEDDLTLSSN
ncbi:cytochrome c [Rubinisphaera margarita]|uniref:cytochrome c n=1 Tax=Rubinisphaera margarita TaxID=2909586 RepID=UPI001EE78B9A|nr:cytochrome c [Rubinisphaera margarita]MCG6156180.1 cytochrome c [Rubinisphaera margarita]